MSTPRAESGSPQLPSLQELSRIMDVASTLRRERETAIKQFSVEETKTILRRRLLEAAELTGESLTGDEVDAAIEQYFENLHAFEPPEPSLRRSLAKLYIHRGRWLWRAALLVAVLALLGWGVFALAGDSGSRPTRDRAATTGRHLL